MVRFFAFLAALVLMPVICLVLLVLSLYRMLVSWIIRIKFKERYAGMLDGSDVMWGLDEDRNSGVVNVLAFVEESLSQKVDGIPQHIVTFLRERFQGMKANCSEQAYRKLFIQRKRSLGFFFWTQPKEVKFSAFIRPVRINEKPTITETELSNYLTKICNRKLLQADGNAWELLVGTQFIEDSKKNVAKYPVLFRFHHSLGDGISILRLILDEIVDQKLDSVALTKTLSEVGERHNKNLWGHLKALYNAPFYILKVLFSCKDANSLCLKIPSPKKVICWQSEDCKTTSNCWNHLLENVNQISPKPSYTNILLAALSGTLHQYFAHKGQSPTALTIAMPIRLKREEDQVNLKNTFTTPMQQLKILPKIDLKDPNRLQNLLGKIFLLEQTTKQLRSSSDITLTRWMMSALPTICPLPILQLLSNLFRITISVSIMPQLKQHLRLGPYTLRDVYFWPPAFACVGVNLSAFSYGGQLRLSLLADRTVLATCEEGQTLLHELLKEIERMQQVLDECLGERG